MRLVFLFTALSAFAQSPDAFSAPSYFNSLEKIAYPGAYSSIQKIDFKALDFADADKDGLRFLKLTKGVYEEKYDIGGESITFVEAHVIDARFALVLYSWFAAGGSSSSTGLARVFRLEQGKLAITQELGWDQHFGDVPFAIYNGAAKTFRFSSAHYLPGDAHCCVSAMNIVTLHWDGHQFLETAQTLQLTTNGKEAGKTLPR